MGNTMHAHLFKRRQLGEREEVVIKLFYPDGTPCDMDSLEGGASSGGLIYKGYWEEGTEYSPNDLVLWNDGQDDGLYLFTTANSSGEDPTAWTRLSLSPDMTGMMRWQGTWTDTDGVHPYGHVVLHSNALWFSLGDAAGEPGVDPLWDVILPASMFGGGGGTVTDWANLTLKSALGWFTQDIAQWRRNGDRIELRGSFRKLGSSTSVGANDFADALPTEHWPERETMIPAAMSAGGYRLVLLHYTPSGRLQINPDGSYADAIVYLDGVEFTL